MLLLLSTLIVLQSAPADTVRAERPLASEIIESAYKDADARDMVHRARQRSESTASEIRAYDTTAKERISLGLRALGRERLFFRRELAARVHWQREGVGRIEVLGARQVTPTFTKRIQIPEDLRNEAPDLAYDPAEQRFFEELLGDGDKDDWIRQPLASGSEAFYRFAAGDTTVVQLAAGERVRLLELRVLPRRSDPRLLRGSLWLDADTHAPVRAIFRLARAFDLRTDAAELDDDDDGDDIPGWLPSLRADARLLTIEYGRWNGRWWLPRLLVLDAVAEVGSVAGFPLRFERAYSDYRVSGEAPAVGEMLAVDSVLTRCPERRRQATVAIGTDGASAEIRSVPQDTLAADSIVPDELACTCNDGKCRQWQVELPADSTRLLVGDALPPSIYADGDQLVTGEEIDRFVEELRKLAPPDWMGARPVFRWRVADPGLLRYNRVEALSVGGQAAVEYGPYAADATARLATADWEPSAEVGIERESFATRQRLAAYRRLAAADPETRPLGFGNSLSALLLGRDDGEYFRALGVELLGSPAPAEPQWYEWRLYAEQQTSVAKETDWSFAHLLDGSNHFRPNIDADRADQFGAALALRTFRGLDPSAFRWGAELDLVGEAGDFSFGRPAIATFVAAPLPGALVGSLDLAGGSSVGEVPTQSLWYLGGARSVRGYAPAAAIGEAFWRARAEIANDLPGARLILFSDAGWAGERNNPRLDPSLLSVGIGASFLDGLLRFDLARALRGAVGWRGEVYFGTGL